MRRPEKIAEKVREELVQIVNYELDDPRIGLVTVTDVRMAENLRDARVYVTVAGTEQETEEALEALRHAAQFVRKQLGLALNMRNAPYLHFVRDRVEERAARVDELLNEIKETQSSEQGAEPPSNPQEGGETPPPSR